MKAKTLLVTFVLTLFNLSGNLWAQKSSAAVKKMVLVSKVKAKRLENRRKQILKRIKATKAKLASLQKQHQRAKVRLGTQMKVYRKLGSGGGGGVVAAMTVRECKRRMRRTFTSSDSRPERRKLLQWCVDNAASAAAAPAKKIKLLKR